MKRRISDLLDHYCDDTVEFSGDAPLSSERIKEITMSRITKKEKRGKRIVFRALVAAAVIASLTLTAFAAEEIFGAGDIFRSIFQKDLSEEQVQVVNELGQVFQEQTQTSQGTTVTLVAAYGDAYSLHLYLKAEAPEGVTLPDGILYTFHDANAIDYSAADHWQELAPGEDAPYDAIPRFVTIEPLADADPTDNKKNFHVTIMGQSGSEVRFNDGYAKYFNMTGIYQQVPDVDGDEDGYVLLAPGEFSFNVGLMHEVQTVELEVDGLTYGGHKTRTWTHDSACNDLCADKLTGETDPETGLPIHAESWDYQVTVKRLALSPLSADWECSYTCSDEWMSFGVAFQVVLKDGSTVEIASYGPGGGHGDGKSFGTTYFAEPIDLDQVDYILIGDPDIDSTCKVSLP